MRIRKGVSAIIFYEHQGKRQYLLLKRKKNWKGWEFLKGGRKKGENESACLKREIKEEIGIKDFKAEKTRFIHSFKYQKEYMKDHQEWDGAKNRVFLVQLPSKKIRIDRSEHAGYRWASKADAKRLLTWGDFRGIFLKLVV